MPRPIMHTLANVSRLEAKLATTGNLQGVSRSSGMYGSENIHRSPYRPRAGRPTRPFLTSPVLRVREELSRIRSSDCVYCDFLTGMAATRDR